MKIPGTQDLEFVIFTLSAPFYNKGEILKIGISGVEADSYVVTDKLRDTEFTTVSHKELVIALGHYKFLKKYNLL